jgi:hypothetical protein
MIPGSHHHNVTGTPNVLTDSSLATWATAVSSGRQSQQASLGMVVEEVDDSRSSTATADRCINEE